MYHRGLSPIIDELCRLCKKVCNISINEEMANHDY